MDPADRAAGAVCAELEDAFWGVPYARVDALRPHLLHARGCVVCSAAALGGAYVDTVVRASAGAFAAAAQYAAHTTLSVADAVAVLVALWEKQRALDSTPAERAARVLAHMHHCGDAAWMLRMALQESALRAAGVLASAAHYVPAAGGPCDMYKKLCVATADIAATALGAATMYLAHQPPPAAALQLRDVRARVARACVLCHGAGDAHARLREAYAAQLASPLSTSATSLVHAVLAYVSDADAAELECAREALRAHVLYHYVVHDVTLGALLRKLREALSGLRHVGQAASVRLEGGTLAPGETPRCYHAAVAAVTKLQAAVARQPAMARLCGGAVRGVVFEAANVAGVRADGRGPGDGL